MFRILQAILMKRLLFYLYIYTVLAFTLYYRSESPRLRDLRNVAKTG